jgi:Lamin Tail Domain
MRYFKRYMLTLFAVLMALSLEVAIAQNNTTVMQPQETRSRPLQLSGMGGIEELAQISGNASLFNSSQVNPEEAGTSDVTRFANIRNIFSLNPSVGVSITGVNPAQRWVQITNEGIDAWNLTGWSLSSGGMVTYTFPAIELEDGASLRIREGVGNDTATEIYTNSTAPLWTGNSITLLNDAGDTISTLNAPT